MNKTLSITPISPYQSLPSVLKKELFLAPARKPLEVRDLLSTYYCLPTASLVQKCYQSYFSNTQIAKTRWGKIKGLITEGIKKIRATSIEHDNTLTVCDIAAPRELKVPMLPDPVFSVSAPYRFFYPTEQVSTSVWGSYHAGNLLREAPIQQETLVELKEHSIPLSCRGSLAKDDSSMLYIKVEMDADSEKTMKGSIAKALNIPAEQLHTPSIGWYIPFITPKELPQTELLGIEKEIGAEFTISLGHLHSSTTPLEDSIKRVFYWKVESDSLYALREKYLLPKNVKGHPLHLVTCFEEIREKKKKPLQTFRLSVSCHAA